MQQNTPETPPTLAPGLYRLRKGGRLWDASELEVVWLEGAWYVTPRVVLAGIPAGCALRPDGTIREASDATPVRA